MGRFINADAYASTGQGLLGNNMFAYCGNNPVMRVDDEGTFWLEVIIIVALAATVHDVYQLSKDDDNAITQEYTENKKSVKINNSDKIITPWVQYGYSFYLNHCSEYRDYFTGTTIGMTYEWGLHNLGAVGFGIIAVGMDFIGMDGDNMRAYSERCIDVDLGPTIFHDDAGTHGPFSHIMKGSYIFLHPFSAEHDINVFYYS